MNKKEFISIWIDNALTKTKKINKIASSSYGLKHICEESIGMYVSNDEIKESMIEKGFLADKKNLNWSFNISSKINKVVFDFRLGDQYSDINRCFRGININVKNNATT